MSFKDNLKQLRKNQNFTQKRLAEKLNISLGALKDWEQGRKQPKNLDIITELTKILDCTYDDLLSNKPIEPKTRETNPSEEN